MMVSPCHHHGDCDSVDGDSVDDDGDGDVFRRSGVLCILRHRRLQAENSQPSR